MSEKIEGTMRLEGLIEGPMPPFPDAREKVEKWARNFTGGVVRISVQFDGSHFSALPANEFVQVSAIAKDGLEPANAIADGIADLLRYFPPLEKSQIFSTIRSVEYRAKQEVQTLYAVGPEGRAVTRQQTIPADTTPVEAPISKKDAAKRGVMGLLVAALILVASAFVVPYKSIWRNLTSGVQPATTSVDAGSFAPYMSVQVKSLDLRDGTLLLTVKRTVAYPHGEAALDALYDNPPASATAPETAPAATASAPAATVPAASAPAPATSPATASAPALKPPEPPSLLRRRLAVESLVKGVVRLDFYDAAGTLIGSAEVRIDFLDRQESKDVSVPAPVVNRQSVVPSAIRIAPL